MMSEEIKLPATPAVASTDWFCVGVTDTFCGHVAHWMQLKTDAGSLRVGWWHKGLTRKPRILISRNNVFVPKGGWELDAWWFSIAWDPKQNAKGQP